MHACTYRAIYTRMHFYIHTYVHTRGYGYKQPQMSRRCVVCVHPGIRTCLDAQALIQTHIVQMGIPPRAHTHTRTHSWNLYMHSYIHMYSHVDECVHVVIHISWSRACAAPDARTRTHTRKDPTRTHVCMYMRSHIYMHTW
jgi:hypothetical protein